MKPALFVLLGLLLVLLGGSCTEECFRDTGTVYECTCNATCDGEPVGAYSEHCAESSSEANTRAGESCESELSSCPHEVQCSCACTSTEEGCGMKSCH